MPTVDRDDLIPCYEETVTGIPLLFTHGFGVSVEIRDDRAVEFSNRYR